VRSGDVRAVLDRPRGRREPLERSNERLIAAHGSLKRFGRPLARTIGMKPREQLLSRMVDRARIARPREVRFIQEKLRIERETARTERLSWPRAILRLSVLGQPSEARRSRVVRSLRCRGANADARSRRSLPVALALLRSLVLGPIASLALERFISRRLLRDARRSALCGPLGALEVRSNLARERFGHDPRAPGASVFRGDDRSIANRVGHGAHGDGGHRRGLVSFFDLRRERRDVER
jgi:hypothetical protein